MLFSLLYVVFFRVQTRHLLPIPILMITHIHSSIYAINIHDSTYTQTTENISQWHWQHLYHTNIINIHIQYIHFYTNSFKWLLQEAPRIIIQPTMQAKLFYYRKTTLSCGSDRQCCSGMNLKGHARLSMQESLLIESLLGTRT